MKALTVCQPWANAIIFGPKRIENRTWFTNHRGPLLIHAGKSKRFLCESLNDGTPVDHASLQYGVLLGVVDVVDCVRLEDAPDDPFAEGPWCWLLENARAMEEPVPWCGQMAIFEVQMIPKLRASS